MRYSLTFLEPDFAALVRLLTTDDTREKAAYVMCRASGSDSEVRLLVREIHPVHNEEVLSSSAVHMKIAPSSFMRAMKRADRTKQIFLFAHSHPNGHPNHSRQDDEEERKLFSTAYIRVNNRGPHASLVMSSADSLRARVWMQDGSCRAIETIRVIGERFRFFRVNEALPDQRFFHRQVLAFGQALQSALRNIHVGIVGAGGTGSSVAEQLLRLGVGRITIFDGDRFEDSNVSRIYGSSTRDKGHPKVEIIKRLAEHVGLNTQIGAVPQFITFESVARRLRDCDVIFGCTDDEWGRSILTRLAIYYYIPVFDMGVRIDSDQGQIRSVQGRVTTLMPGAACLFCRGRLSPDRIAGEVAQATNPEAASKLRKEGYIPELSDTSPAVVSFTTAVAASAISELLHRLTGFMGAERTSTETLHLFDQARLRTNSVAPDPACFCSDKSIVGRGDSQPLLDVIWRAES